MSRRSLSWVGEHALLIALGILFIAPIVFVALTSVMSGKQTLTASIWPDRIDFERLLVEARGLPPGRSR